MDAITKLTEYFEMFPGIGPRQAKRFVYFLLSRDGHFLEELSRHIEGLREARAVCDSCFRYFTKGTNIKNGSLCSICGDHSRSPETLIVVAKEVDAENIERSRFYDGRYFILGGHLSLLEKNKERHRNRLEALVKAVNVRAEKGLKEIILAFAVNPEGEHTTYHIRELLIPLSEQKGFRVTTLGRGLSTGTELEYPDAETIKNALTNRR